MKKLKLTPSAYNKGEVLTRSQLKKVMGGEGSGSPCHDNSDCGLYGVCNTYGLYAGYCADTGSGGGGGTSCQVNNGGCTATQVCVLNAYGYATCW